jgi:hypothetical protein
VAKQLTTQSLGDLATAYKSFFFDLPLAGLKWSLGAGEEKDATAAAWKGYDAGVRMASATIDALYRNPLFSNVFGRALSATLQWQQVGNAVSGALFTSMRKAVGAPSAAELQGLSEQVRSLDARFSQVAQQKEVQEVLEQVRTLNARLPRPAPTPLRAHADEPVAA